MSAARPLPLAPYPLQNLTRVMGQAGAPAVVPVRAEDCAGLRKPIATAVSLMQVGRPVEAKQQRESTAPVVSYAFYRKHTESLLKRYLYASMQVGRSPALLADSVGRGWVSSRRVRTFEDAVIFVLDIERCLNKLSVLDRQLISRIVLQEYTQSETADFVRMSVRTVCTKFPQAIDRLTELLLEAELLVLPG